MRLLLPALACVLVLSACAGPVADVVQAAEDAVNEAVVAAQAPAGVHQANQLRVENETDAEICQLLLEDFDDPAAAPDDLLDGQDPIAPGEDRVFTQAEDPLHDNHNLLATAEGCDGTTYEMYSFKFIEHGGVYSVRQTEDG